MRVFGQRELLHFWLKVSTPTAPLLHRTQLSAEFDSLKQGLRHIRMAGTGVL